jgi:hypothetical protein
VERLVQAHGGSVEAHSAGRGAGSEFIVRLSCLPGRKSARDPPAHASRQNGTRRILVVDDNADSAESVAMLLEESGHEVRTAKDGAEALATAMEFQAR